MPKGYKHGGAGTPEYNSWLNMKQRCHNPKRPRFKDWGARGITVCDRWRNDFAAFLADMGEKPSPDHTLDRKNGELGYSPENCRWATKREQSENRPTFVNQITHNGKTQSLSAWSREIGISRESLRSRIDRGWGIERALTQPRHPRFANFVSKQVEVT